MRSTHTKPVAKPDGPPRILISGLGRSGTSWLYKTFDHHPGVVGIFEPDLSLRARELNAANRGKPPSNEFLNKRYDTLFGTRTLRSARRRPIIDKSFRSPPLTLVRIAMIYGLSVLERGAKPFGEGLHKYMRDLPVPDFACRDDLPVVAKTVSGGATEAMMARLRPGTKAIIIVRHPCGFVRSVVEGSARGKVAPIFLPERRAAQRVFKQDFSVDAVGEEDFTAVERAAMRWAVYTNWIEPSSLENNPSVRVLTYEDLCRDPIGTCRDLFAFAGLDFHPDCERFLQRSLTGDEAKAGEDSYHATVRNPEVAAHKWRTAMSPADIKTVRTIASKSAAACLFPDLVTSVAVNSAR
jgi:hypothetical protein